MRPLPFIVSVVVSACASTPHQSATSAASVAPAVVSRAGDQAPVGAVSTAPAQPSAPSAPPATAARASASTKPDAKLLHDGYQAANYHGQTVYCRVESPTGSRFARKVCLTPEQIRAREENAKEVLGTVRSDTSCAQLLCQ